MMIQDVSRPVGEPALAPAGYPQWPSMMAVLSASVLGPVLAPASVSALATASPPRTSDWSTAIPAMPRDADPKRVLPEAARARLRAIAADPQQARAFLQRAGIIDDAGQLTRNYR